MRTISLAIFHATAILLLTASSTYGQASLFDWTFGGGGSPSSSYGLGFAEQGSPSCLAVDNTDQIVVDVDTSGENGVSRLDTTGWEIGNQACFSSAGWGLGLSHDMQAEATQSFAGSDLSEYTLSFDAWLGGTADLNANLRVKFFDNTELDEEGEPVLRAQLQNAGTPINEQLGPIGLTKDPQSFSTTLDKLVFADDFSIDSLTESLGTISAFNFELDATGGESGAVPGENARVIGLDADNELHVDNIRLQAPFIELPTITLVNSVVNDNGGTTDAATWLLTAANGPNRVRGKSGDASIENVRVPIGNYSLTQDSVSGYRRTSLTCDGTADLDLSDGLDLASGEKVVCTFVNDDISPILTLEKAVTNDNGGTAVSTDWTLSASGPMSFTGVDGTAPVRNIAVDAGRYTLTSSDGPMGYALTSLDCVGARDTEPGTGLSLFVGEQVTCTFTSDDIAPTLTLANTVVNDEGGLAADTDWVLAASGPRDISGAEGSPSVSSAPVDAGNYSLSQSDGPENYTLTGLSCLGGMDLDPSDGLMLALAENVICTFVNDDIEVIEECDPNTKGDIDGNGIVEFADFLVLSGSFGDDVDNHLGGDLDCDGSVGFSDFLTLSSNFGKNVNDVFCDSSTGGDLDGDGFVAFADFLVMSGNFGKEVDSHLQGDIDCDGMVGFSDFLTLSGNFGKSVGEANAQAVPEPATHSLMCLAGLMFLLVRRRR